MREEKTRERIKSLEFKVQSLKFLLPLRPQTATTTMRFTPRGAKREAGESPAQSRCCKLLRRE